MRGKKILNFSIIAISFTVLMLVLSTGAIPVSASSTLVVDDDGMAVAGDCDSTTAADSSTIQGAVDAAIAGDTIIVCDGTVRMV